MLDAIVFTATELIMKPCVLPEMRPNNFVMYLSGKEAGKRRIMIYGVPEEADDFLRLTEVPEHDGYRIFSNSEIMQRLFTAMGWDMNKIYVASPVPSVIQFDANRYIAKDALCMSEEYIHAIFEEDIFTEKEPEKANKGENP